jgi:hypothetical protein
VGFLFENGQDFPPRADLYEVTSHNYDECMSQTQSTPSKKSTALEALSEIDRTWLAERLVEYRDILDFLQAH